MVPGRPRRRVAPVAQDLTLHRDGEVMADAPGQDGHDEAPVHHADVVADEEGRAFENAEVFSSPNGHPAHRPSDRKDDQRLGKQIATAIG